ncbi:MAG: hypothetical protein LBG58_13395 [Planctomycetaceae bacterium]|jgi:hypothetical protein|nr:hypothetical protein [Planctomycetaceae bacterium]
MKVFHGTTKDFQNFRYTDVLETNGNRRAWCPDCLYFTDNFNVALSYATVGNNDVADSEKFSLPAKYDPKKIVTFLRYYIEGGKWIKTQNLNEKLPRNAKGVAFECYYHHEDGEFQFIENSVSETPEKAKELALNELENHFWSGFHHSKFSQDSRVLTCEINCDENRVLEHEVSTNSSFLVIKDIITKYRNDYDVIIISGLRDTGGGYVARAKTIVVLNKYCVTITGTTFVSELL